jgi:hypothetical protein
MKLYHSFDHRIGFDLNKQDYERGIFAIIPWWTGKKGYEKFSEWTPNEFGSDVVELDINDSAKVYTSTDQLDLLEKLFPNSTHVKQIVDKFETGNFEREDWHKMDKIIGKYLRKKGYQLIHYTNTEMYGDEWAIINKDIIKGMRFNRNKPGNL